MNFEQIVRKHGQEHLLHFYECLDSVGKTKLENQIASINWNILSIIKPESNPYRRGQIEPISAMSIHHIETNKELYNEIGISLLKKQSVGVVILAGGQGSRLGYHGPKGTLNIGKTRNVFIFQLLIDELIKMSSLSDAWVPLFIMTNDENHQSTVSFFELYDYFGYPHDYVHFFLQEMLPCLDFNGKLLMASKDSIAFAPNGNGGWFHSLVRNGFLDLLHEKQIHWLNVVSVDNVLQKLADPVFIGAVSAANVTCGTKVVRKKNPREKVGVICCEDGVPSVVEYYDMEKEMSELKDEHGQLVYCYGVTLNYLYNLDALERADMTLLPIHLASKKIPFYTKDGHTVIPSQENGYKLEYLILDSIKLMRSCLPFEVNREIEFAPIKNRFGEDSIESAQHLLEMNGILL